MNNIKPLSRQILHNICSRWDKISINFYIRRYHTPLSKIYEEIYKQYQNGGYY